MKTCLNCLKSLPLGTGFALFPKSRDGRDYYCKECRKLFSKIWRAGRKGKSILLTVYPGDEAGFLLRREYLPEKLRERLRTYYKNVWLRHSENGLVWSFATVWNGNASIENVVRDKEEWDVEIGWGS